MYNILSSSVVTLTTLLSFIAATPTKRQEQTPYFAVRNFTFSNGTTSARYTLQLSFPEDVVIHPADGSDPTLTIPGFTDPVPCTGTYFYSPSETSTVTLINACGYVNGDADSKQKVTTKLDVVQGDLYLTYTYNATVNGKEELYVWSTTQAGISPVDASAMEGFNTPANGPAIET